VVRRYELQPLQFELLKHLQAGQSLDQALAALALDDSDIDDLAMRIQEWFAFWAAEHFFAAAHVVPVVE
jgi:hypothetical protein